MYTSIISFVLVPFPRRNVFSSTRGKENVRTKTVLKTSKQERKASLLKEKQKNESSADPFFPLMTMYPLKNHVETIFLK